eukprot:gene14548-17196_t
MKISLSLESEAVKVQVSLVCPIRVWCEQHLDLASSILILEQEINIIFNFMIISKEIVGTYSWGRGDFGQIGQGSEADISTPIQIEVLREKCIVHVASNVFHSCVVTADGELFMFGLNENGQLGCKNRATQLVPARLDAFESYKVVHAACGQMHTVVVTHQGTLASWGAAEFGQLGHGEAVGVELPHPRIIKGTAELRFAQVACGAQHTLALTTSGHVFAFGQGTFGALGLGDEENRFVPTRLESLWATGIVQ